MWKTPAMTDAAVPETPPAEPPAAKPAGKKKRSWGLWIAGGIVLVGMGSCLTSIFGALPPPVEDLTVLELDLRGPLPERASSSPLDLAFRGTGPTLRDVTDALDRAASDGRVAGVVARLGAGGLGLATTQELRDAVARFRASGKPALAWADSFGGIVPGNGGYYLATAFDEVWLSPVGEVGLVGLSAEVPFLAGALEKLGVTPELEARHEHKTYKNLFTETGLTEPHREQLTAILRSQQAQLIAGVAAGRGLAPEKVSALLAEAPFPAERAKELGLVDRVGYRDEVLARVDERVGGEGKRLFPRPYLERASRPHETGPVVALIYASGTVQTSGTVSPLTGGEVLASDVVSRHLRAAVADDEVRAILLRVDSPGGSHIASDVLRREIERARAAGKPVVVSMGNVAGSGGYMIAMAADRIVAQPGTLTGSIGVVGGKLVPKELFDKLGITFEQIELAPRAGMASVARGFDEDERVAFEASLDRIYADFVAKAAAARGVAVAELEPYARGRVWTGAAAKERGLVDELGGVHAALGLVRELAGLAPDADVELRLLPRKREPVQALLAALDNRGRENSDSASAVVPLPDLPWLSAVRALGVTARAGVLEMPAFVRVLEGL